MDSRQLNDVTERLRASGLGEQLGDYQRTSVLVVAAGQEEFLRLRIVTGGGDLAIDTATDTGADVLVVRIDAGAAHAVGAGTSLLEDEFAAGAVTLDGARPDDYRQAPVLEHLLEGLTRVGALRPAEPSRTEAPA